MQYILDENKIAVLVDKENWKYQSLKERQVAVTYVGDVMISTVFLSIDHNFGERSGNPLLFETMVFGGALDGEQERCSTWGLAEDMHMDMVERVKNAV